jgi:hypothetical protein
MAYIGKQPVVGNFVKLDAITTSATTTFNLLNGGTAYYPQTANNCIVSLNGVIQSPTTDYTISGSTIVFASALTTSDVINFIIVLGDVLAIGTPSDGTVNSAKLASGTTGLFAWQSVQTTGFTAVAGRGYPCNTTSAAFTVTLPASATAGDTIKLLDYAGTFATNNITLGANGLKINGGTLNKMLTTAREAVTITYVDSTQGWVSSSGVNYGTQSLDSVPYSVDFLVVAGGGGGGKNTGGTGFIGAGGGGAGGYRNSYSTETSGGGGSSETELTFNTGTVYTVTVGAGGAGSTSISNGSNGVDSSISGTGITTITSLGGGGAGSIEGIVVHNGSSGGSGGGAGGNSNSTGGSGTSNQGYAGGSQTGNTSSGGGGGASAVGQSISSGVTGGNGGAGLASSITGSSVSRAGGGGAGAYTTAGTGGTGGGGNGGASGGGAGTAGTANTGGGGGGGGGNGNNTAGGASGGSGVVILRMPTASYSGTTTGSPTVSTSGSDTILVYNSSGTYTG